MSLITTTKGDLDESLLEKRENTIDNDNERTLITEYWLDGELVHRSAHVTLKPAAGAIAGAVAAEL
jgi:hypothetical protein